MHFISFVNADLFLVITLFGSCDESSPEVIFLFRRLYTRIRGASLTVVLAYRPRRTHTESDLERGNKISAVEDGGGRKYYTAGHKRWRVCSIKRKFYFRIRIRFDKSRAANFCSEPNLMFRTAKPSPIRGHTDTTNTLSQKRSEMIRFSWLSSRSLSVICYSVRDLAVNMAPRVTRFNISEYVFILTYAELTLKTPRLRLVLSKMSLFWESELGGRSYAQSLTYWFWHLIFWFDRVLSLPRKKYFFAPISVSNLMLR